MRILGLNAFHGDVAAAITVDGALIAAVEEERFRRVKHWAGYPEKAICASVEIARIAPADIEAFAVSRNPRAHRWRKAAFLLRRRPSLSVVRDRLANAAQVGEIPARLASQLALDPDDVVRRTYWVEHHSSHLASAFFASPFEEAAVCAIDGFGDFVSTSTAVGRGRRIHRLTNVYFPHSLGLLYLAITQHLGFPNYGDEYKVMGLAPYGTPDCVAKIRELVRLLPGGRFQLDLSYFRHVSDGVEMTWSDGEPKLGPVFTPRLEALLGPARQPDGPLTARHEGVAASLQVVFEEAALHVLRDLRRRTGLKRLCYAGGCAMNSVLNGKIRAETGFEEVYIQPAAGDNGTALGAALYVSQQLFGEPRRVVMDHAYWGPEFSGAAVAHALAERAPELTGLPQRTFETDELCAWTARQIASGRIVGWFQGRMEWGARALGNRSILADPRRADMREMLNTKIKFRERFRPFAPSVLEEAIDEYFLDAVADPFMIQVYPVRPDKRAVIPAVTHADGSGRLQTVSRRTNPLYWNLIRAFEAITGVPVLLNTSFNENEPIAHRPEEALDCFLRTDMDVLVIGRYALEKGPASNRGAREVPISRDAVRRL